MNKRTSASDSPVSASSNKPVHEVCSVDPGASGRAAPPKAASPGTSMQGIMERAELELSLLN